MAAPEVAVYGRFMEILDSKEEWRAVRLDNGRLGVTDAQGKVLMRFAAGEKMAFVEHDFLRVSGRGVRFFVDMRSQQVYAERPKLLSFGQLELLQVGNLVYTRTKRVYEVNTGGVAPVLAYNGSYLLLPRRRMVEEHPLVARRVTEWLHAVCVLAGDFSRYYWNYRVLKDGTVVVMDERGWYYHVTAEEGSARALKRCLGRAVMPAEEERVDLLVEQLEEEIRLRQQRELEEQLEEERRRRAERLESLRRAVPFVMGSKWGLKLGERIVVPPLYRQVRPPVGLYCAFEQFPGRWGVLALDGKVVVEPRYQAVELADGNRALLTLANGVVETRVLPFV